MCTKNENISSGLVAVAWIAPDEDRFRVRICEDRPTDAPLWSPMCWVSDAEAIIAQQSERIKELESDVDEEAHIRDRMAKLLAETAVALKGPEKALHRHGWQDLPDVAAKQSAALKLARDALENHQGNYVLSKKECQPINEALAAINEVLKGE